MSNAEVTAPKQHVIGTPFPKGTSGNPAGRPRGSRNKLADAFISDLRDAWELRGAAALAECSPEVLVKVIASLLPRDLNLNVGVDLQAAAFVGNFRQAVALLHGDALPSRPLRVIGGKADAG